MIAAAAAVRQLTSETPRASAAGRPRFITRVAEMYIQEIPLPDRFNHLVLMVKSVNLWRKLLKITAWEGLSHFLLHQVTHIYFEAVAGW